MLSATAIVLLDEPRVKIPASLASLFVMKRCVVPLSKMSMNVRALFLMPSWCEMSCVL